METIELKAQLKKQIVEFLNLLEVKPEDIKDDEPLFGEGLGLDSIDSIELIVLLNREYGIVIEDPKEGRKVLVDINTMVDYIEKIVQNKLTILGKIVVTGMGVISAIGNNVTENRHALIEGKSGISTLEMFPSKFVGSLPVGEIKISDNTFIKNLQVKEQGISRTTLLALHAFNEAVADSNLSGKQISSFDTAFITASTVGGMCHTDMMYNDAKIDTAGSPFISSYEYAATSLYLQKRFSLQGHVNTINTACSSSANAIMYGAKLIKSGRANRVIVGGVDSLAKFTINGFNALHILSAKPCTPFDEERTGLNLGEAAAFIVLEKEEDATHKKNYATLSGYSNANDSYHASTLSNEANGPYFAMKAALEAANLLPSQINYVNAHGTSTENNDLIESIAMLKLFENAPLFSSTKANTGHTLGAAAAVEAVYCILNLYHQELYGALRFYNPIATTKLAPIQAYTKIPLSHVMSNSFGFGGNCSSLIFSKI